MRLSNRRVRRAAVAVLATVAIVATTVALLGPSSVAGGRCRWVSSRHPNPGRIPYNLFRGIDGRRTRSGPELWAVGSRHAVGATLAEHYRRGRWTVAKTPNRSRFTQLEDVAILGRRNAWAVGWYVQRRGPNRIKTLIEHWNGRRWSVVPSPNPLGGMSNILKAVDAVSRYNVWAVGSNGFPGNRPVILHYNGSRWTRVRGARVRGGGELSDVVAISKHNVVAVGSAGLHAGRTLIERYNGRRWHVVGEGDAQFPGGALLGVAAARTRKGPVVWAVGNRPGSRGLRPLAIRSRGSGWKVVSAADLAPGRPALLYDVAVAGPGNVWAVGARVSKRRFLRTLVGHYSGGHWRVVESPNPAHRDNVLFGLVRLGTASVWAVGEGDRDLGTLALVQRRRC